MFWMFWPTSIIILFFGIPQRSRQFVLTPFTGQHKIALGRAARGGAPCSTSCVERSDRSEGPVRPVAVQNDDDPTNARPGGTPSGQACVGLP